MSHGESESLEQIVSRFMLLPVGTVWELHPIPRTTECWTSYVKEKIPKSVKVTVENGGTREAVLRLEKVPPQRWVSVPVKQIFYQTELKSD